MFAQYNVRDKLRGSNATNAITETEENYKMKRYMLALRILVTLLILTMLLPGWGMLGASNAYEMQPTMNEGAIGILSPFDR